MHQRFSLHLCLSFNPWSWIQNHHLAPQLKPKHPKHNMQTDMDLKPPNLAFLFPGAFYQIWFKFSEWCGAPWEWAGPQSKCQPHKIPRFQVGMPCLEVKSQPEESSQPPGQGAGRACTKNISALPLPWVIPHTNPGQVIPSNGKHLSILRFQIHSSEPNLTLWVTLGTSLSITAGEAISWFCCFLHTPLTTSSNFSTSTKKCELVKDPAGLKIKKENINPPKSRENHRCAEQRSWQQASEQENPMGRARWEPGMWGGIFQSWLAAGSCSVKY